MEFAEQFEKIGSGGTASIYKVDVKYLPKEMKYAGDPYVVARVVEIQNEDMERRVKREIKLYSEVEQRGLKHFIRYHGSQGPFLFKGKTFYISYFDYASGGDLFAALLQRGGDSEIPLLSLQRLIREIASGIMEFHTECKRVLCDVSLRNIVLVPFAYDPFFPWCAKFIDLEYSAAKGSKQLQALCGNIHYVPPEVVTIIFSFFFLLCFDLKYIIFNFLWSRYLIVFLQNSKLLVNEIPGHLVLYYTQCGQTIY